MTWVAILNLDVNWFLTDWIMVLIKYWNDIFMKIDIIIMIPTMNEKSTWSSKMIVTDSLSLIFDYNTYNRNNHWMNLSMKSLCFLLVLDNTR